jgi:hypothetical protein
MTRTAVVVYVQAVEDRETWDVHYEIILEAGGEAFNTGIKDWSQDGVMQKLADVLNWVAQKSGHA